jgi:hypothetical protein
VEMGYVFFCTTRAGDNVSMSFWNQMNKKNTCQRNLDKFSSHSDSDGKEDNDRSESSDEDEFTLEKLLSQWDMCDIEVEHPEWLQEPEFVQGFAMMQLMNMDAIDQFANAASNGNMLALVAIGDFFYRLFEFQTNGKRYRFGTDAFTDGLIKGAMTIYALAMMHEPYFEKMQERLLIFQWNFARESEYMDVLEKIGEKLTDFSFDHPEELRKIFSL